ncbi:ATP-dependent DNA ligase [Nakamurella sp. YIM 132087]|uniref:DNA ligase n=1 Tax=Nakamurella alba TaxID=2665158 RepID=A0A7K1FL51_9ACTN|nr:ATP-dependent DNA ligase [Nakamurella alba]MTD14790.1 ATP-dependent DNA ligase [Nakamurella alba]
MLLARLAETSAGLAATRSRLAKRALLAACIAEADADEIGLVVGYLSGSLRQRRTGVGWATLGELPPPADTPALQVADVDGAFERISGMAGAGSAQQRTAAVEQLFARATAEEQGFLRGLVFGELRQGALVSLVQDGLAAAFDTPAAGVQRAAMLLGSTADTATLLATSGPTALAQVGLRVGVPIGPMLAAPAPDAAAAVAKSGLPAVVDTKLDGIRVQVHRNGDEIHLYTRSLDEITDRLPEVVEAVARLPITSAVIDGEVVGLDHRTGRPLPFQVISARTASSADPAAGRARTPLRLFAFDLLHLDGRDLLDEPLQVRAEVMAAAIPDTMTVPRRTVGTVEELVETFAEAVTGGWEGLVVKRLSTPYAAGRRDSGWIKLKPRHTFDLAVIGAEWGYGRRQGWLSNLHLAARGDDGSLVMLGKTFKGLTDKTLTWQTEQFLARESRRTSTTVFVDPPLVAEIAFDGVQRSSRYPGGVALRFARVLRYREDKGPDEIDALSQILALSPPDPFDQDEEEGAPDPAG